MLLQFTKGGKPVYVLASAVVRIEDDKGKARIYTADGERFTVEETSLIVSEAVQDAATGTGAIPMVSVHHGNTLR